MVGKASTQSFLQVQVFPAQRKITISGERSRVTKGETDPTGRPYRWLSTLPAYFVSFHLLLFKSLCIVLLLRKTEPDLKTFYM